jgi:broad specificity phosphatase PhoE
LRRAVETARFLRADIQVREALREWSFGAWDGLTWADIESQDPENASQRLEDWFGYAAPGQESWPDFVARVEAEWLQLATLPRPLCIVGHQAVNSVIWRILTGTPEVKFQQRYCEILLV